MLQIRGLHLTNVPTSIDRAFVKGFSGNQNYPLVILPLQDLAILLLQIITVKSTKCYSIKAQELRKSWKSPLCLPEMKCLSPVSVSAVASQIVL